MRYTFLLSLALVMLLGACSTSSTPTGADAELDIDAQSTWRQYKHPNFSDMCLGFTRSNLEVGFVKCDSKPELGTYWYFNPDGLLVNHAFTSSDLYICATARSGGGRPQMQPCSEYPQYQSWIRESNGFRHSGTGSFIWAP